MVLPRSVSCAEVASWRKKRYIAAGNILSSPWSVAENAANSIIG